MRLQAVSVAILLAMIACVTCDNICDICSCQLENYDIQSVNCDCGYSGTKNITTTVENMKDHHHIRNFAVSNCESLTFEANSFKNAPDLTTITVTHVGRVAIPVGVFSALTTLKIEHVQDLHFGANAFMGAPISAIYIRSSHLHVLPERTFYAMKDVRKFELFNITVNHIQKDAILLTADQIQITDSVFESVAAYAINISALNSIDIDQCTFEFMENDVALIAASRKITIRSNVFSEIPIGLLVNSEIKSEYQISFTNNTVRDFTLQSFNEQLSGVDFSNNRFQPNCSSIENVLVYKSMLEESDSDRLLVNNYWDFECLSGKFVSLTATVNMSECNEDVAEEFISTACLGPMPTMPPPKYKEVVSTQKPREGKGLQDEPMTTTTDEVNTARFLGQHQDNHMDSSSNTLRKEVGLMGFLLFLIVVSLRR